MPWRPPEQDEAERTAAPLLKDVLSLRAQRLAAVAEWRWGNESHLRPGPYDGEKFKGPPLKWLKREARYAVLHGLDSAGAILLTRSFPNGPEESDLREEYPVELKRHKLILWADYLCKGAARDAKSPKLQSVAANVYRIESGLVLWRSTAGDNSVSVERYEYEGGRCERSTYESISGLNKVLGRRTYRYIHDAAGKLTAIETEYWFPDFNEMAERKTIKLK